MMQYSYTAKNPGQDLIYYNRLRLATKMGIDFKKGGVKMTLYLVWTSRYGKEIVDEAENLDEARYLKAEYNMAYSEGYVSIKRANQVKSLL